MMTYVWAAVIVGALLVEGVTLALVAVWMIPGALAALIMSLCSLPVPWQMVAFVSITLVTMILGFKIRRKKTKTNVDSVIGKTVLITEEVNNIEGKGAGKVGGLIWSVRTRDAAESLVPGDLAEVLSVEGVKLICRKK